MKKEYEVLTESGGFVTKFSTEQEARDYVSKNNDRSYQIKEKSIKTWIEYLAIFGGILIGRYTGLIGVIAVAIGYFVYRYLSKKMGMIASVTLGTVSALIVYLIEVAVFISASN